MDSIKGHESIYFECLDSLIKCVSTTKSNMYSIELITGCDNVEISLMQFGFRDSSIECSKERLMWYISAIYIKNCHLIRKPIYGIKEKLFALTLCLVRMVIDYSRLHMVGCLSAHFGVGRYGLIGIEMFRCLVD